MSESITFKAQLSPLQSCIQHGPDGMMVKLIPQAIDADLAGELFRLQQCALRLTVRDTMGDFTVDASLPDTASAIRINKSTPQVTFHIPRADVLIGLRLVALFGVVFTVEITGGAKPEKAKREKKPAKERGTWGKYWQAMFRNGALNHPDWPGVLECEQSETKQALKTAFAVESMTFISPDSFEKWCAANKLEMLITMSRNAAAEAK